MSDERLRLLLRRFAQTQSPEDAMRYAAETLRVEGFPTNIVIWVIQNSSAPDAVALRLTEVEAYEYAMDLAYDTMHHGGIIRATTDDKVKNISNL